jgi:hypothetical protein
VVEILFWINSSSSISHYHRDLHSITWKANVLKAQSFSWILRGLFFHREIPRVEGAKVKQAAYFDLDFVALPLC